MNKGFDLPFITLTFILCCMVLMLSGSYTILQAQPEIPSSFNPVGSGARAMGMGGAFIGVADDATAASWNPGGLFQLELPEVSIVGKVLDRREDNRFEYNPEASTDQGISENSINYLSIAYCIEVTERFSLGLTLNIWDDLFHMHKNKWEQDTRQWGQLTDGNSVYLFESSSFDRYSFRGYNVNLWYAIAAPS